jgi:hypothetical protein
MRAIVGVLIAATEFVGRLVEDATDDLPLHLIRERIKFSDDEAFLSFLLSQHWYALDKKDFSQTPVLLEKKTFSPDAPIGMGEYISEPANQHLEFYTDKTPIDWLDSAILIASQGPTVGLFRRRDSVFVLERTWPLHSTEVLGQPSGTPQAEA